MSIPDKDELYKKLESTGLQQVRENLAQGLYAGQQKLKLINEWILKKERELSKTERTDEVSDRKKTIRIATLAVIVSILGIAVMLFFNKT